VLDCEFTYIFKYWKTQRECLICKKKFSARWSGFDPRSVHMRFVVDRVALGQVSIRTLRFLSLLIPTLLYTHLHLHVAFPSRTNERSLRTFQKQCFSEIREHYTEKYFYKHQKSKLSPTAGAVFSYLGTQIKRKFPTHNPR